MLRRLTALCISVLLVGGLVAGVRWLAAPSAATDDEMLELPVPPFPPRVTQGRDYEACLGTLAGDAASALAIAEAWQANGGGDGAAHCRGLALIAIGKPDSGAEVLERLSQRSSAPAIARALVLGQAVQARLMLAQADKAAADASFGLELSPGDAELLIMRAAAEGMTGRCREAVDDLNQALRLDPKRSDALVSRAAMLRRLNQLAQAQTDVSEALALNPDDPDALLERGILRQLLGDAPGAQTDWEHVRGVDPNSTTADLAMQNLSLLEAGPQRQ